jgi:SulP family sulfate permease
MILKNLLPPWLRHYHAADGVHDLIASFTLVIFLIPQGLAYALLAGLPPQAGLYASIVPVVFYALVGSSATLSVGPAALPSLMTTAALATVAVPGAAGYAALAAMVALLSGVLRLGLGALRFGFIANFLSQSVVGGFVSGSAILILLTQLPHLLGIESHAANAIDIASGLWAHAGAVNHAAVALSAVALAALYAAKRWLKGLLLRLGLAAGMADLVSKASPIAVVAAGGVAVAMLSLQVKVVGTLPPGLPPLAWPAADWAKVAALWPAILAIGLVGFIDSYSIAQALALKRRETVEPNRELLAVGLANAAAGLTGGFPVSASFGRSAANELAGARTQLASVLAAGWMALILLVATRLFATLPLAVLACTIVIAVAQLVDLSVLRLAWRYDRRDALVYLATAGAVLLLGVVDAVMLGVGLSLALFIWRTSQPHLAVIGRVQGSEHYRNELRHRVETDPHVLAIRIDESLYFANVRFVRSAIISRLQERPTTRHLLLVLSAVNAIDVSALQGLRELNRGLREQGVELHLAEVKGPVLDQLKQSGFLDELSGGLFLSTHVAMTTLRANHGHDFVI